MKILIPEYSLILLIGPSSAGKSTFATKHFSRYEVVSSDQLRAWVCDDENNQKVSGDAFALMHMIVNKRLKNRRLTVVDATNLSARSRKTLKEYADGHGAPCVAIVLDIDTNTLFQRRKKRKDRNVPGNIVNRQIEMLQESKEEIKSEGYACIYTLHKNDVDDIEIARVASK